jgi:NTE family protein
MTADDAIDRAAAFLATSALLQGLDAAQVRDLARVAIEERYPAGTRLLTQGQHNSTLYFLRTGALAVRVVHGSRRVTVAHLEPPAVAGEISFATGRTCSADLDVAIDATLLAVPLAALDALPCQRDHLVRGLMTVVAERLHTTMTRGLAAETQPIVLLRHTRGGSTPRAFAAAVAASIAHEMGVESLVVHLGRPAAPDEPMPIGQGAWRTGVAADRSRIDRAALAESLTAWAGRYDACVLDCDASLVNAHELVPLATHQLWVLGPGEPVPAAADDDHFIVQDARGSTLPWLSARRRLFRSDDDETARSGSGESAPSLGAAADAVARGLAGRQIGLALGGGGAWGWAHIGVLEVLERANVPVDAITGCSMGCVLGGYRASGASLADLHGLAEYWKRRYRRWSELRVWRLHLANERRLTNALREMFGARRLECFPTPFWANALDIESGAETTIRDGTLVDAVRASMAFPGWTPPVRRGLQLLVDAAMIDPVPASLLREMHCDRVIAVNTFGPLRPAKLMSRLPRQAYHVVDRYFRRAAHEIGRIHGEVAADVTLSPLVGASTMLGFDRTAELIEAGRRAASERLAAILEACGGPPHRAS